MNLPKIATSHANINQIGTFSSFSFSFAFHLLNKYNSISLNNVIKDNMKIIKIIIIHHFKEKISKSSTTICHIIQRSKNQIII